MKFVDLFCGCGGASLGLIRAGLRHYRAFDVNHDALASYRILTGHQPTFADLSSVRLPSLLGRFRGLIWVSPPCQPISIMQNKPNDIRVKLLQDVLLQLITQYPTSWIVFENVENVIRLNCLQTAFQAIHRSRGVLFDEDRAKTYVVNAADLGVPQNRRRLVLPIPPVGYSVPPPLAKTSSPKTFGQVIGKGFKDPDPEHWGMTAAEKIIQDNLDGYCPSNSWDVTPTCVLASKRVFLNSGKYNHPNGARRLSVGENMAIQGLPLVKLAGDMASRYRQVGNAVPPPLSEAIGKQIICHNTKI